MIDAEKRRNALLGETLAKNYHKRGYAAYYCEDRAEAKALALSLIPSDHTVGFGGSATVEALGLLDVLEDSGRLIDRRRAASSEERAEIMRRALLADTFLMSTNAGSYDGVLVNMDGIGNRVAALIYGPKQVIVLAGINKFRPTVEDAVSRLRNTAAPINCARFEGLKTPCRISGTCERCTGEDSICAQMVLTRLCKPQGRIKLIIVGETLGF